METQPAPIGGAPSNVVTLLGHRKSSRQVGDLNDEGEAGTHTEQSNSNHGSLLPFPKTAHGRHSKAQRVAHLAKAARAQGLNGKTGAAAAQVSKAAHLQLERLARAQIRERVADVAQVLNLSREATKPAMTTKHEHLANFAKKHGVNIEWLVAGTGCVFRSRGELFERAIQFERLLRIEKGLRREYMRRRAMADRLAYEKLGIDPDDRKACRVVHEKHFATFREASAAADREICTGKDWTKWNSAVNRRVKAGKEIMRFGPPMSCLGLVIRLRVITCSEDADPERMLAEISTFFSRSRIG